MCKEKCKAQRKKVPNTLTWVTDFAGFYNILLMFQWSVASVQGWPKIWSRTWAWPNSTRPMFVLQQECSLHGKTHSTNGARTTRTLLA